MKPELLHVLACPACRGDAPLTPSVDALTCTTCARSYPIVCGVPRMLLGTESQETKQAFTEKRPRSPGVFAWGGKGVRRELQCAPPLEQMFA